MRGTTLVRGGVTGGATPAAARAGVPAGGISGIAGMPGGTRLAPVPAAAVIADIGEVPGAPVAQLGGTDNAPTEPARPAAADTVGPPGPAGLSAPVLDATSAPKAEPTAGAALVAPWLAPVVNCPMSVLTGDIANCAGVDSMLSGDMPNVDGDEKSSDWASADRPGAVPADAEVAADLAAVPARLAGASPNGSSCEVAASVLAS